MTEIYCSEPVGVNEQEQQYLTALSEVRSYEINNNELLTMAEQGSKLLRYQLMPKFEVDPAGLIGKTWQLVSAPGIEGYLSEFTLIFDGTDFNGTTICRNYAGTYQVEDDRLEIVLLEMTTDAVCDDNLLWAEGEYTTLLENINQYNLLDIQLELYTKQAQKLIFELGSE